MTINFVIILCTFAVLVFCRITLENGLESTKITMNDLSLFSDVLVEA